MMFSPLTGNAYVARSSIVVRRAARSMSGQSLHMDVSPKLCVRVDLGLRLLLGLVLYPDIVSILSFLKEKETMNFDCGGCAVTTAVFSTCGMSVWTFSIAAILSLPKQFITVYLGYALELSENGMFQTLYTLQI